MRNSIKVLAALLATAATAPAACASSSDGGSPRTVGSGDAGDTLGVDSGHPGAVAPDASSGSPSSSSDAASPGADDAGQGADAAANEAGVAPCPNGPPNTQTAPQTIDTTCFTSTFDDEFQTYDISSGPTADGMYPDEKWFNGTEQCCLTPSNGNGQGGNYPTPGANGPINPYALIPGGGLSISASFVDDNWYSGVMTSVDQNGNGFSQEYGYFEINTQLPAGTGTWPAFWMLPLASDNTPGEIDIFEQYGCNPPQSQSCEQIFWTTLHDWTNGGNNSNSAQKELQPGPDLTAAYHSYGMLWNATYMAVYFDGNLQWSTPTLAVMSGKGPYYLLADMGLGSGFDTSQTPNPVSLLIKSIRAYSVPGF